MDGNSPVYIFKYKPNGSSTKTVRAIVRHTTATVSVGLNKYIQVSIAF